jgi:hypothetical protein
MSAEIRIGQIQGDSIQQSGLREAIYSDKDSLQLCAHTLDWVLADLVSLGLFSGRNGGPIGAHKVRDRPTGEGGSK